MEKTQTSTNAGAYVGAAILIVIGLVALIGNLGGGSFVYASIPFAIGVAFLVAYTLTRQYGFLVPGGIVSGVGAGVLMSSFAGGAEGGVYVLLAIGLGFLLVFVIDVLVARTVARWWPLIPGSIMLFMGAANASGSEGPLRYLQVGAPALLIALGMLILIARLRRQDQ